MAHAASEAWAHRHQLLKSKRCVRSITNKSHNKRVLTLKWNCDCLKAWNTSIIRRSFINTMKLMTHNVLSSKGIKSVKTGYPLKIEVNLPFYSSLMSDFNYHLSLFFSRPKMLKLVKLSSIQTSLLEWFQDWIGKWWSKRPKTWVKHQTCHLN